jgi:peptidoglycan/LPS O-acetylase OafA/YrhL
VLTRADSSQQTAAHAIPIEREHLAALDGTRFIAAFCVLAGHGYHYVVLQQDAARPLGPISRLMLALPGPGMTLFFVLSGFVIHLNYHRTVAAGWNGTFDFFIARFSRLYPLFLAVFAIDFFHLFWLQGYPSARPLLDFDLFGPLPFFLSFTQTWLFIPFNGYPIYEHYGTLTSSAQATGAMWSLSTEWLFYAAYPWLSGWLARQHGRRLGAIAAAVALAGLGYCVWCSYNIALIREFGLAQFGTPTLAQSFVTWVTFYSPVERMLEFLLGAVAAQQYLSVAAPTGLVARRPAVITAAVAAVVAIWIGVTATAPFKLTGMNASCAAALVAAFVLLVARHPSPVARLLGHPVLVRCGEASYSLYLLHFYTMHQWAAPYALPYGKVGRAVLLLIGILISIALARVVYLWFERPALRWLRINFRPLKLHIALGLAFAVITFFSIVASLQIQAARRLHTSGPPTSCAAAQGPPGARRASRTGKMTAAPGGGTAAGIRIGRTGSRLQDEILIDEKMAGRRVLVELPTVRPHEVRSL